MVIVRVTIVHGTVVVSAGIVSRLAGARGGRIAMPSVERCVNTEERAGSGTGERTGGKTGCTSPFGASVRWYGR